MSSHPLENIAILALSRGRESIDRRTPNRPRSADSMSLPDIESERSTHRIASFAFQPADVLAFQAMIVHGAPGNNGKERRRALSTRWTGDDARYCVRRGEASIPTEDPGLEHGDRMECERFPLVWKA